MRELAPLVASRSRAVTFLPESAVFTNFTEGNLRRLVARRAAELSALQLLSVWTAGCCYFLARPILPSGGNSYAIE
jgi:hypothetical protein